MPTNGVQEWLAFALLGLASILTALAPALPAATAGEYAALGILLVYAAGIGMLLASPTVTNTLETIEARLSDSVAE
jgi:hypothetical protein